MQRVLLTRYIDPRPEGERGQVRTALMILIMEHEGDGALPTSIRFLYYELVADQTIPKDELGSRKNYQKVVDASTDLRNWDHIPWDWIVDETRSLDDYSGYSSIKAGVLSELSSFNLDPWKGKVPLILTESRSLRGVLRAQCADKRVRTAS